jgi:2-oxo-4-hydroxy-4-carboxy--5-ureidoimidazoline (OHCU) decarboxylase
MKDNYIKQLSERIETKKAILKDYHKRLKESKNEETKNALNIECLRLERAIQELNFCLRLYKDLKGGLK